MEKDFKGAGKDGVSENALAMLMGNEVEIGRVKREFEDCRRETMGRQMGGCDVLWKVEYAVMILKWRAPSRNVGEGWWVHVCVLMR